jgi:hypothetical protein
MAQRENILEKKVAVPVLIKTVKKNCWSLRYHKMGTEKGNFTTTPNPRKNFEGTGI